jgi:hypothetical protein
MFAQLGTLDATNDAKKHETVLWAQISPPFLYRCVVFFYLIYQAENKIALSPHTKQQGVASLVIRAILFTLQLYQHVYPAQHAKQGSVNKAA